MIVCSVNNIEKVYGGNVIFQNLSLEIKEKQRVALVGRNGSGKTTLLRLIAGEETPDAGQIHWKRGLVSGYLSQIPEYTNANSVKDVLRTAFSSLMQIEEKLKQMESEMATEKNNEHLQTLIAEYGVLQDQFSVNGGFEIDSNIEKIAYGLNIQTLLEQPFSKLSGGEKTKVGLGVMLLQQPDMLLLDEPTNHLDLIAVEWLGQFLQTYQGTVVIISHDRYFLDEVTNKVIDLEEGELTTYHSNFSGFVKEKEEKLLREFMAYEEQQKKIKKMKETIKRLRDWANRANPPNASLHRRARNMERAIERMEIINRPVMQPNKMKLSMEMSDRSGKDVIKLTDVSKCYNERIVLKQVNLLLEYQERAAIVGENGTGKSTLIKLILKQIDPSNGEVSIGSNVKFGYLSQQIFVEMGQETVIEVFREEVSVTEGEARAILARFMFYGYDVFRHVSQLSGGERMRLRLAQLMYQDINVLLLDEPTNHLDIESREVLEEALSSFQGTILAVSHDRYFLNKLFDKIYWIESKQLYAFEGDYNWAKKKMNEIKEIPVIEQQPPTSKRRNQKQNGKKSRKEEIDALEQRIMELEEELLITNDVAGLQELYQEKETLENRWEAICDQL
ncbi:ribosomal protection-like ABC-F family protein [Gracilibacillus salinarum]|uniref:ABC-F family ATP-binding cassette domain-containing protein n=1 Tax=Gracilibacillus salinarum TaxID=2932255 RepID=A0ABY4GKW8_9BACI|nr:ABC-F family ATP-binding cassette domain-containing protein [Gracilibacillus salinarum]UOQ84859.1 ABC-F family ATP-binding cassette domain-containing protein [Gracilibacillus salinarum]